MKFRLFSLAVFAACGLAGPAAAEPAKPQAASDIQDFVFFAEGRPLLVRAHVRVDGKPYRAIWDEYVDRVMKFLDKDRDGTLAKAELAKMPPVSLLTGNGAVSITYGGTTAGPDADKDGKVTRDELAAWLRRSGASPFQFQMGSAGPGVYGAKVINLGESEPVGAEKLNAAIVRLLDANRDGKLSREELAAAPAAFAAKDTNDDEMVTPTEVAPPAAQGAYFKGDAAAAVVVRGDRPTGPVDGPVMLIDPTEPGTAVARKLLAQYGKGKKKLAAADLGLDAGAFARLDADRDGGLDAEELAQFAKRAPDLELTLRVGTRADGEAEVEGTARAGGAVEPKLTKSAGGTQLDLGVTRVDLRAGTASKTSAFGFNFRLRDQYINQFKMADTDANSYLDATEAGAHPLFRGLFQALDTDGDGMLYEKEMVAYLDQLEELQKAVREGCVTMALSDKGNGLFDLLDRDRDGRLSVRELRQAPELLTTLDRNGDGSLARAEIPHTFELRVRRGPAGGFDSGNVVVVARASFGGDTATPEKAAGPVWFRKMDTNRDGDLSRREFLGTDADFRKLDADGDGLVSQKEAEAAEKLWPAAKK